MSEIKAEGLDEARAALDDVDQVVAIYGHTMDYGAPSRHLRHALTVADALAARLAEVEGQLERARAAGPRWERPNEPESGHQYVLVFGVRDLAGMSFRDGKWRYAAANTNGLSHYGGYPVSYNADTPQEAARAVCERLGLPVILDGLPDGGVK